VSSRPPEAAPPVRRRVVYVAGSGHSGSTLLALLAQRHPAIATVGETAVKPRIRREGRAPEQRCSCGARLDGCPFWQRIFARVQATGLAFDASHWTNDYRFEHPWLDRLLTKETVVPGVVAFRQWAARHLPFYRARVHRVDATNVAFIDAVLAETGATVFLDTTKLLTRLLHLLAIPALDLRIVWLTRDVRGYANSARRRGARVDEAATTWRRDQEAIGALVGSLSPGRALHVRYEDLCRHPFETLRNIFLFSGLEALAPDALETPRPAHVLGNQMRTEGAREVVLDERWRQELSASQMADIERVAGAMNARLGHG